MMLLGCNEKAMFVTRRFLCKSKVTVIHSFFGRLVLLLVFLVNATWADHSFSQTGRTDASNVARYFAAISRGDAPAVSQYLQQGVSLVAKNEIGLNGLQLAAFQKRGDIVEAILSALPPPAKKASLGQSPSFEEYLDSLSFDRFVEQNVRKEVLDAKSSQGLTAVHLGIGEIQEEEDLYVRIVAAILVAGADPNSVDSQGQTPLHKASVLGLEKVVRVLLGNDANPLARTTEKKLASDLTSNEKILTMLAQSVASQSQPPGVNDKNAAGLPAKDSRKEVVVRGLDGQPQKIEVISGRVIDEVNPAVEGEFTQRPAGSIPAGPQPENSLPYRLSEHQQAVQDILGFPQFFSILLLDDDLGTKIVSTRLEKWVYTHAHSAFTFCDGQCVGIKELETPEKLPKTVTVYNPTQFSSGMTADKVLEYFGQHTFKKLVFDKIGFQSAGLRELELWSNGTITLGFQSRRLVTVQATCRALPKP